MHIEHVLPEPQTAVWAVQSRKRAKRRGGAGEKKKQLIIKTSDFAYY